MPTGQIVGLGGAGSEQETRRLLAYVVELTGKPSPKVCVVPTAAGDDADSVLRLYGVLPEEARASHLPFFPWPPAELRRFALEHDLIFVGGGNTANALSIWRVHGFDRVLREAWEAGIVLTGWSAGMICWFEAGVTDSFGPQLDGMRDGLGFLPGSACPHYDGEKDRRPTYHRLVHAGFPAGYAADDGAALHFVDTALAACVVSRPTVGVYRVAAEGASIREKALPVRLLSS